MNKTNPYDQLLNVMEGYTADGEPRGAPIAIPGGNKTVAEMGLMVGALLRLLDQHIPEDMQHDRVRTAIIVVFVQWMKLLRLTTHQRLRMVARRVVDPHAN